MTLLLRKKILIILRKAFPHHEDVLTDGLGTLIVYFLYFSVVIMLMPLLLTCKGISFIDFNQTGAIGDTIGGVMGPFVALLAAFLTFLAFWIQYRANNLQRDIAEKQLDLSIQQNEMVAKQTEIAEKQMRMAEEQEKKYAIERFENTLHQMLDVYSRNSESVRAGELSGKEAFEELAAELFFIYQVLAEMLKEIRQTKNFIKVKDTVKNEVLHHISQLLDDKEKTRHFLMDLAYALFFSGFYIKDKESLKAAGAVGVALENELYWRIKEMVFVEDKYSTYKTRLMSLTKVDTVSYRAPYEMACGHNGVLGHYYRQMLQMVKFVSDAPEKLISEEQKYEYVKLLRSQMCDAEQVLFYYNSTSVWGKAWRERHGNDDDDEKTWSYIIRYRLIKNIPVNYPFFGIPPTIYYKEDIKRWEGQYGKSFFETDLFGQHGF